MNTPELHECSLNRERYATNSDREAFECLPVITLNEGCLRVWVGSQIVHQEVWPSETYQAEVAALKRFRLAQSPPDTDEIPNSDDYPQPRTIAPGRTDEPDYAPATTATTEAPAATPAPAPAAKAPQAPKFKVTVTSDYEVGDDRKEYDQDLREWLTDYLNNSDTQRKLIDKAARRYRTSRTLPPGRTKIKITCSFRAERGL